MDYIEARLGDKELKLKLEDIYYFRSDGSYTRVVHTKGEVLILESLNSLEERYGDKVLRVQRAVLINMDYLISINEGEYRCSVTLEHVDERLPVSKRRMSGIRRKLSDVRPQQPVNDTRYSWILEYIEEKGPVSIIDEQFVYSYIKQFDAYFVARYASPKCPQLSKDLSDLHKEGKLKRRAEGTPSELILREYPKWVYLYNLNKDKNS